MSLSSFYEQRFCSPCRYSNIFYLEGRGHLDGLGKVIYINVNVKSFHISMHLGVDYRPVGKRSQRVLEIIGYAGKRGRM